MDSGASIAPSERIRPAAVVIPTPIISTCSTRQRRSDVQAIPSTSESVVSIPEENEKSGESGESEESEESEESGESGEEAEDVKETEEAAKEDEVSKKKSGENKGDGLPAISAPMASEDSTVVSGSVATVVSGSMAAMVSGSLAQNSAVVETFQRGRSTTPKPADGDISMQSPVNTPPKLYGASRTSGGVFRGQAVGNSLNAADFLNPDNNNYIGPVQGQVNIYLSQDDSAQLSPDILTVYSRLPYDYASKTPIAPVLEKIAQRYSPVRSQ